MVDRKLIGEILVDMGVVTADQVDEALEIKRRKGGATGAVLVELGHCTDRDISTALAIQSGMKQVNLDETEIPLGQVGNQFRHIHDPH